MSEDLTKKLPQSDSEKLALILSTVQALSVRVDSFEQSVKVRLHDPRPILQKVVSDIAQLQEGQRRLEEGQETLRSEFRAMRRSVNHRFMILSGTVLASYRDLHERVNRLELNNHPPNSQT